MFPGSHATTSTLVVFDHELIFRVLYLVLRQPKNIIGIQLEYMLQSPWVIFVPCVQFEIKISGIQ